MRGDLLNVVAVGAQVGGEYLEMRGAGGAQPEVTDAGRALTQDERVVLVLARAGFRGTATAAPAFDGVILQAEFWLEAEPVTDGKRALREHLARAYAVAEKWRARLSEDERRAADYLLVKNCGFPAYMGGAFSSAQPGI